MSEGTKIIINQKKNVSWAEVSSSEEDEEQGLKAPQSPKVIRTDKYKNKRFICSMVCVLLLFIWYLLIMQWMFHANDEGSGETDGPITARVGRFHHNHRIHRCDDRGFDCCYLYTEQHNYQFNPKYIVGKDEEGSNCPSLEGIVGRYNDYLELYEMNANCTEVPCCHVDNTRENKIRNHRVEVELLEIKSELKVINHVNTCPSINDLMFMETHHYPDPNQDLYIMVALFGLLFFWGLCSK
jgi:hypothetical protein